MKYYKLTIQYDGTEYCGFQWQDGLKTIQNELNLAISKIIKLKFSTMAASRTDTGVHAIEQVVKLTTEESLETSAFFNNLNLLLPNDIRILTIVDCASHFKPAAQALSKEYRYFFTNHKIPKINVSNYVSNISNPLDFEAILKCIDLLKGEIDFKNFYSSGSNVKSTVRDITVCEISKVNPHHFFSHHPFFKIQDDLEECYEFKIVANGFLKQMNRHIVSALWMVGSGKLSFEDFSKLLNGPLIKKQKWKVASPKGLFLVKISYQ